jgi:hypothetical protein
MDCKIEDERGGEREEIEEIDERDERGERDKNENENREEEEEEHTKRNRGKRRKRGGEHEEMVPGEGKNKQTKAKLFGTEEGPGRAKGTSGEKNDKRKTQRRRKPKFDKKLY